MNKLPGIRCLTVLLQLEIQSRECKRGEKYITGVGERGYPSGVLRVTDRLLQHHTNDVDIA
ncbi:hypothetical protein DJ535_05215 [Citrobacter murliniae]|uniref:Uncharacterized protein n=1 Tax=Citrobacter murliniae TaxID=67829 RepID=A0ABY2PYR8_9ENTR|nr:hypothetical protein DJ535_05215 [Citrobacter murliniae]